MGQISRISSITIISKTLQPRAGDRESDPVELRVPPVRETAEDQNLLSVKVWDRMKRWRQPPDSPDSDQHQLFG